MSRLNLLRHFTNTFHANITNQISDNLVTQIYDFDNLDVL